MKSPGIPMNHLAIFELKGNVSSTVRGKSKKTLNEEERIFRIS